ncbi:MAG: RNA-directed DNA polymerase [Phycisphaerae bacterium]|nr:RNA-directed DNA polymerase [Phycisphaerae bacterium]
MGFFDFLKRLFSSEPERRAPRLVAPEPGLGPDELARRLGLSVQQLESTPCDYHEFAIRKRSGGTRQITAPNRQLKTVQRKILKRLLGRLCCHPCATGFEKRHSIVTNAAVHVGADAVLRMDMIAFFRMTTAERIRGYFYGIGWGKEATDLLIRLCTHNGALPQGAPTSPRLSNLVNIEMDTRLACWARKIGAAYTRYADDVTFSFPDLDASAPGPAFDQNPKTLESIRRDEGDALITSTIRMTKKVLGEYGYELHNKRKLNIRRRHQQQRVCGLVVNEKVALPRRTRRWLRAVRHHHATGRRATLTAQQLAGWDALEHMIALQAEE